MEIEEHLNALAGGVPRLETGRLVLRGLAEGDVDALFRNYADREVTRYFMSPVTRRAQAEEIVADFMRASRDRAGLVWGLTLTGDDTLIGTCGYERLSRHDRRGEIGYDLARPHWGRGLMHEALQAVIACSFATLELNRIEAFVMSENMRSLNTLKRLGFQVEGVLREHRRFDDRYCDDVLLALLKSDRQR